MALVKGKRGLWALLAVMGALVVAAVVWRPGPQPAPREKTATPVVAETVSPGETTPVALVVESTVPVESTAPEPSPTSELEELAEQAVEDKVGPASTDMLAMSMSEAQLAFAAAYSKRTAMMKSLAPYADKREALLAAIRADLGEVTAEKVPALLARAADLQESFWLAGDFDNAASFDAIYEARAVMEIALEADPKNEAALRQYVEVLTAGWPYFLNQADFQTYARSGDEADHAFFQRNFEGRNAARAPLQTLWDEYVSKRSADATLDDLAAVADLMSYGPQPDEYRKLMERLKAENPGSDTTTVREMYMKEAKALQTAYSKQFVDWGLAACAAKNGEWDYYRKQLEETRKRMEESGFAMMTPIYTQPWGGNRDMLYRYSGRMESFQGPQTRKMAREPMADAMRRAGRD